jgi:hypothetical protein
MPLIARHPAGGGTDRRKAKHFTSLRIKPLLTACHLSAVVFTKFAMRGIARTNLHRLAVWRQP